MTSCEWIRADKFCAARYLFDASFNFYFMVSKNEYVFFNEVRAEERFLTVKNHPHLSVLVEASGSVMAGMTL